MALRATFGPRIDWFPWHLGALVYLAAWALIVVGGVLRAGRLCRRLLRRPAGSF